MVAPLRSLMVLNLLFAAKLKNGALMLVEMARTGAPLPAERRIN